MRVRATCGRRVTCGDGHICGKGYLTPETSGRGMKDLQERETNFGMWEH